MKKKKYRKRKIPKFYYVISLGIFLFLGVGYSVINSTLGINGTVVASQNSWNIYFTNLQYSDTNVSMGSVSITNGTTLNLDVTLENPGDKYEFTFDIKNEGTLDSLIRSVNKTALSADQQKFLTYTLTYSDGEEIKTDDLLKSGETKTAHVLIQYKNLRVKDDYPENDVVLSLTMGINYYQPLEDNYTVTLNYGGNTKTYNVSNLTQTTTVNDLEIPSDYKVVACNNEVVPTTDNETGKIIIKNVKNNAICRLETSVKNAITNSGNEKTNITIISDDTSADKATISATQDITIDLNGKNYTISDTSTTTACITLNGNLTINDSKGNGQLNADNNTLLDVATTATLNTNGVTLNKVNSGGNDNIINCGGVITLKKTTIGNVNKLDGGTSMSILKIDRSNTTLNILDNSVIDGSASNDTTIDINNANAVIINVKDSTVKTSLVAFNISVWGNVINLCNSKIEGTAMVDLFFGAQNSYTKVFYSKNTIFKDGTNVPSSYQGTAKSVINSDIACGE